MWGWGVKTTRRPSPGQEGALPKRGRAPDPNAPVDPRYKGLKLRKRRARYRESDRTGLIVLVVVFVLLALFLFTVDLGF